MGKPSSKEDAADMLRALSGKEHSVITGVCIRSNEKRSLFHALSKVRFDNLSDEEIDYYIEHYSPMDKAGSYGAQEWVGYVGILSIEGSYFNVMGLPIQRLYRELADFCKRDS